MKVVAALGGSAAGEALAIMLFSRTSLEIGVREIDLFI
jgi:hypothetical protein